jgi:hypothetical protein
MRKLHAIIYRTIGQDTKRTLFTVEERNATRRKHRKLQTWILRDGFRFVLSVHLALLLLFGEVPGEDNAKGSSRQDFSKEKWGRVAAMPRTPAPFKQADVRRAWAAARRDGKEEVRTEIGPDGRIVLVHKSDIALVPADAAFEAWKAKRNAYPA